MTARASDSMFYPLTLCALEIVFMIIIMIDTLPALDRQTDRQTDGIGKTMSRSACRCMLTQ